MDAVKFLEEYSRMCNAHNDCVGCPMDNKPFCYPNDIITNDERKELVIAVERWSCEHSMVANDTSDTISRAAAIDAVIEWYGCKPDDIEALEEIIKAMPPADRPTGHWVGAREFCQHLEEVTGEKYQATGIGNTIYCDQCWQASSRRSKYCPNCGSCNDR